MAEPVLGHRNESGVGLGRKMSGEGVLSAGQRGAICHSLPEPSECGREKAGRCATGVAQWSSGSYCAVHQVSDEDHNARVREVSRPPGAASVPRRPTLSTP